MAVSFGAGSSGYVTGATSLTISHTVGSGSDRLLVVQAVCVNSTDYLASATVTYGGSSLGSPVVTPFAGSSNNFLYTWVLVAPPVGTANVVITLSSSAYISASVSSYFGVHQSSPVSATNKSGSGYTSSPKSTAITTPTDGVAVDFLSYRKTGESLTPGAGQTAITAKIDDGAFTSAQGSYKADAAAMAWSFNDYSSSAAIAHCVVALAPASGGGGGDTTAPTLTSPSGAGGALTCSGSVTTDEGNGTLYAVVTASDTAPSKAQVKAGQDHTGAAALRTHSQAISSSGSKSVPGGSVTAGTRYFHFMHEDAAANQSAVVSSASFTVTASAPTINTQPSNQTVTAPATATFTVSATASAGTLSYQWQREPAAGGGFSNISGETSASYTTGVTTVSGGSHNNGDKYRVNVTDSNGSTTSSSATLTVNASGSVSLTSSALRDNTGTLHLSASFEAFVLNVTTGALVVKKTGLTSHASTGVVSFTDASLVSGTQYRVIWRRTDTGAQGVEILTAA